MSSTSGPGTSTDSTVTVTTTTTDGGETTSNAAGDGQPALMLRLSPNVNAEQNRRIVWAADTIDNEHMGKKKSKCCCIYKKPKKWDDPSDDEESGSDCETEHCKGHVDKKK